MADERQVNDVLVYRDSAGFYRERPVEAGGAGAGSSAGSAATATTPKGYQPITSDQLASAQSLAVPAGATRAVIQNNGAQAARYRNDGTDPTPTTGARLNSGDEINVTGSLAAYSFIREAEGAALDVMYYG